MNLDKMMRSLDKRFTFGGHKEDSHEKEDGSRTSSHSHDADDEPVEDPTVTELKARLRDAQAKANSYRDKAEAATDRVSLFQDEVAEITKEAISLKTQLEESLKEKDAMTKTIDELKSKVVEGESESDKAKLYHDRALEATKEAVSLKAELRASKARQASMETTIDELRKEAEEYQKIKNTTAAAAGDEEELEASKRKVKELEEMVDSMKAEKVETQEQLASHVRVISDLTATERGGGFANPNSEHLLLLEATQKLKLKDYEVRNLNEKILSLESKLRSSNGDHGSSTDDSYRSRFHELQKSYNGVVAQNEEMYRQLHSTRKTNEQLKNQKEAVTKKELERVASMKQYQKELDARDDHFFFLEKHTEELEKKLQKAQQDLDARQQERVEDMGEEGTAAKTRQQQVLVLQNRVAELEEKLQIADARRYKDKGQDAMMADESGVEEKSGRDLLSPEATAPSSSSAARNTCCCSTPKGIALTDITGQRRQPFVALKYAVGVASLSIFLGFLLLKKHYLSG